jgi:hypothetical protein
MEYRTVYTDQKVLTTVVNDSDTVTSSLSKFIIDTIPQTIARLAAWGVDISYFWKNDLSDRLLPSTVSPEIAISDHPTLQEVKRKAFVWGMSIDQVKKEFRLNLIIRHFDAEGNYTPEIVDDAFYSSLANNDKIIAPGVGEFDYFVILINQGANMFTLQETNIPILDGNGRFNNLYE